jgi:hypothetical protein
MNIKYSMMATVMAVLLVAGTAAAGSVSIGLGEMDRAEFEQLKQMVNGQYQAPSATVSTPMTNDIRVAEFNGRDVDAIRRAMETDPAEQAMTASASHGMVDIGTGAMSTREFCNLNNLVASQNVISNSGFEYLCP